jgi:hypothetical protein
VGVLCCVALPSAAVGCLVPVQSIRPYPLSSSPANQQSPVAAYHRTAEDMGWVGVSGSEGVVVVDVDVESQRDVQ